MSKNSPATGGVVFLPRFYYDNGMLKRILVPILLFLFIIIVPPFFYFYNYSQTMQPKETPVSYELAYPGILPNHPLYVFKQIRDGFIEFVTRDQMKKAHLHLQMSDKMTRSAQIILQGDKNSTTLAFDQLKKGEEYFEKTLADIKTSGQQGVKPLPEFINQLKLSQAKHKEVIENIKSSTPVLSVKLQHILDQYDQLEQQISGF
jgi:hypothetical protein